MRFWLLHSGEVPLQQQIAAQISLGILSGELAPGERLPSVRELARRFHIHSNTVSLAYRRLERELWLESRRGSGMYVRAQAPAPPASAYAGTTAPLLDSLLTLLVESSRRQGLADTDLRERFERTLAVRKATALLLLEPDPNLQRIVLAELQSGIPLAIATHPFPAAGTAPPVIPPGTLALVLPSKTTAAITGLPPGTPLHTLKIRSIPQSLAPWLPASTDTLVAIASQWPPFLDFAKTMLIAAGFHPDTLLLRNPAEPNWQSGLSQTAAVVCDAHTATLLHPGSRAIPFPILADQTIPEVRNLIALDLSPSS